MTKGLLADYRSKFIQHMTGAANNVVQACKVLAEAKGKLAKDDFGKLIEDLNLSSRDAEKYVRIGNDKRFDAIEVKNTLPYAWTVLDRISSLDDNQFKEAVKSGLIKPTTTRAEIDAFKNGDIAPVEKEEADPNSVKVATIWVDKSKVDHTQVEMITKMLGEKLLEIQEKLSVQPLKLTDHGLTEKLKPNAKKVEKEEKTQRKQEQKALSILAKAIKKKARRTAQLANLKVHQMDFDLVDAQKCIADYETVQTAIVRLKMDVNLDEFIKNPKLAEDYYKKMVANEKKGLPV